MSSSSRNVIELRRGLGFLLAFLSSGLAQCLASCRGSAQRILLEKGRHVIEERTALSLEATEPDLGGIGPERVCNVSE